MLRSSPLVFTRESIRRVDRLAMERYGIASIVLMENAGAAVAREGLKMLEGSVGTSKSQGRLRWHTGRDSKEKSLGKGGGAGPVVVYAGPGNNGGDGFVAARHLHNAGVDVRVVLAAEAGRYGGDAAANLAVVRAMRIPMMKRADEAALVVDALLGTGLDRPVEGRMAAMIGEVNAWGERGVDVLAVDIPSGLDADTGGVLGVAVKARRTVTLCGWKLGFLRRGCRAWTGKVVVAGIGVPRELLEREGQREAGKGKRAER